MDNPEKLHGNIGYTRHMTKTNKIKTKTKYVLDTTLYKTKTNKANKPQHNTQTNTNNVN